MRALTAATLAAINAVITAPGHLVYLGLSPTPLRWCDIGQVTLPDGTTWAGVDMRVQSMGFSGDAAPQGFSLSVGNLDSAAGALLLANDLNAVPLQVFGFDRAAIAMADLVNLGEWNITGARIGIDAAALACSPVFYTAPFRRVDEPNGFKYATPAGTKISWGAELLILDRLNYASGYIYKTR